MVIHWEMQSLAEVQKTIAIYDFALASKLQALKESMVFCCL